MADKDEQLKTASEKIQQLETEKKDIFKEMLKDRKTISRLEDEILDYKTKLSEMKETASQKQIDSGMRYP